MMSLVYKLLFLLVLGPLGVLSSTPRLASRQIDDCGPSPVDCGNGWCCWGGNTCQAAPDNGFICLDTVFTNSDGSPATFDAFNPTSWDAVMSSLTQPLTLTLSTTTQVLSISVASTTAIANSSSSPSDKSTITPGPSSAPARTSTIIPTTTSSSFGESSVRVIEGWWVGVLLGVACMLAV